MFKTVLGKKLFGSILEEGTCRHCKEYIRRLPGRLGPDYGIHEGQDAWTTGKVGEEVNFACWKQAQVWGVHEPRHEINRKQIAKELDSILANKPS